MSAFDSLSERQKEAVFTLDRNILLLAAAGTGKTSVLTLRIANILTKSLAKPSEILCLTFTNRACKEMKERIAVSASEHGSGDVIIKTIHSYCYYLIKQFYKDSDIAGDFTIFDEDDCIELLRGLSIPQLPGSLRSVLRFICHCKEQKLLKPGASYQQILQGCLVKDRDKVRETCREAGAVNESLFRYLLSYGAALISRYDRLLKERHALDFNDLLFYANEILSNEEYLKAVRDSLKFIHIDEVQDTTLIEYQIIKKIFGNSRLLLCGDYFQTIYQWRGSKPRDIFSEYVAEYDPLQIVFNCNYRSTKTLLDASIQFLKESFPDQMDELYPEEISTCFNGEDEKIRYYRAQDIDDEARWIYHHLKELSLKDLSKAAVLCRNNAYCQQISNALDTEKEEGDNISFLQVEEVQFFRSPEIRDVLAFLRLCVHRCDDSAATRILLRYARGVGVKTIQKLQDLSHRELGLRLPDYLHPDTIEFQDPYAGLQTAFEKGNLVVFDVESTGVDTGNDEIIQIAAVKLSAKKGVYQRFEEFICPSKSVGDSVHVHHYSDEFLKENGKEPAEVLNAFSNFIKDTIVVGHNVGYDLSIFKSELARLKLPKADFLGDYDTLDIARRYLPKLPNHKLETLAKLFDTQVKSSHDAMDDVLATQGILVEFLRQYIIPQTEARKEVLEPFHKRFKKLANLLQSWREQMTELSLPQLISQVMEKACMEKMYSQEGNKNEKLSELLQLSKELQESCACTQDALFELLKVCTLSSTNLDRFLKLHPRVPILTIHQAKGAEFDVVFLAGLQEGQFPSYFSLKSGDLQEERRTFYVAMTRAKARLFLSCCDCLGGRKMQPSRFISEISDWIIQETQ